MVPYSTLMKATNIRFDDDFHKEITEFCKKEGYSLNGLVTALLKQKINGEI